jgi:hypothetical protein
MSYVTAYASAGRDSRVHAPYRPIQGLRKVSPLAKRGTSRLPRFVFVAPSGRQMLVDYGDWLEGYDSAGALLFGKSGFEQVAVFATDACFFVAGGETFWNGKSGQHALPGGSGRERFFYFDGRRAMNAGTTEPSLQANNYGFSVQSILTPMDPVRPAAETFLWSQLWDGIGLAAVNPTGDVVVAMEDGAVRVLAGEARVPGKPGAVIKLEFKVPFKPYDISAGDNGIVLLEAIERTAIPTDDLGRRRYEEQARKRALDPTSCPLAWETVAHVFDPAGHERWSVRVPFRVLEPPIQAGHDQLYLVGDGVAAVEHGTITWSGAPRRTYGTAFEGGELAAAVGSELRIVAPGGAIKATFRVDQGETITAPPAIASDGGVWVATEKNLYVAR